MGNSQPNQYNVPETAHKQNKVNETSKKPEDNTNLSTKNEGTTHKNQSNRPVETKKKDNYKVEDLRYSNLHNNTNPNNPYPYNTHPYSIRPNSTHPNGTHPNSTHPNSTHPNSTHPNSTHSCSTHPNSTHPNGTYLNNTYLKNVHPNNTNTNNIYPKLQRTYSDDTKPSCPTKEELYDNKSIQQTQNVSTEKKDNIKSMIKPPPNLVDIKNFMTSWTIWKEQLMIFLNLMDENKEKYHLWGNFLLNFMGVVSQEILDKLIFYPNENKNNFSVLINKFDAYYKFNTTTKSENESIMDYVEKLKIGAVKNIKNVDYVLKEKLASDIEKHCKERFIALASCKLSDFNFDKTFKVLTLAEIAFLWNLCIQSNCENNKNCNYCGKSHLEGQCLAKGKECNKCKRRNHFAKCCPGLMYINNCGFCGGDHGFKRCPAFGETCTKCAKQNHFSWMCSKAMLVKNCRFCGLNHMMDRNKCPAKNSTCCICKTVGHYEVKCRSNKTNNDVK
ncbi:uncharacterized protein LOC118449836 isoform X1 [Vespa mandarinia]|uniref:uncharacterized protein LOC118449836 isoform X1 n=1 Tax=Vespa mandarinia TaxID=7446 RepID=UPI00161925F7|nr:uncharacterized protein LOC118449836 isoform X1 [Vespa mandarinia]